MGEDIELKREASAGHVPDRPVLRTIDYPFCLLRLHAARDIDSLTAAFAALFQATDDDVIACPFIDDGTGLLSPLPGACPAALEQVPLSLNASDHLERVYGGGEVVVTDNIGDILGSDLPELDGYRSFLCRLAWEDEQLGVLLVCDHGEIDLETYLLAAEHLSLALVTLRALSKTYRFGGIDPVHWMFDREWLQQRLTEEVERALRYRRPLSLLLFRFNNLDALNEEDGSGSVRVFLRRVAAVVRGHIRNPDVLAALSDDTIAVLLPETDRSASAITQNRIAAHILQIHPHMAAGSPWKPDVSCGLGCVPEDGENAQDLVSSAEVMTSVRENLAESA